MYYVWFMIFFITTLLISLSNANPPISEPPHPAVQAVEAELLGVKRPFETDFCSLYPEGTRLQPELWKECCIEHDLLLWAGGTRREHRAADRALKACIRERSTRFRALSVFLAVRIAAASPVRFKGYWGNAWGGRKRKKALTPREIDELEASLYAAEIPSVTDRMKADVIATLRKRAERKSRSR